MKKIIIIGGGNSGLEAANIISKMKNKAVLITENTDSIGSLSCNPSMGGIGKSQLVREIDSLGGLIGYISTKSSVQLKKINISKGEAVSCTRSQICRKKYKFFIQKIIKSKNIDIIQDEVIKIIIKNKKVIGVKTKNNFYKSDSVIITAGTFLNGNIYIGLKKYKGGRLNEKNSIKLAEQLKIINISSRLKTGTPPRINSKNINLKNLKVQKGDFNPIPSLSSWYKIKNINNKKNCWITESTEKTKEIIKKNLEKSPIYKNLINGTSPRYCPSIEDKIYKFYNKKKHNIFLEPDNNKSFYPSGLSTSLPYKEQIKLIRSIKGLENCNIIKPGYAVEYDFFCPKNLKKSLEFKFIKGLFFAGQINGTTGYEEAAAQGIVAGINSSLYVKNKKFWYPNKKNTYIGLMIHDITKNGVTEPYRVFTNRSENRLILREDNSDLRLINVFKNLKLKKKYNSLYNLKIIKNKFLKNNIIFIKIIKSQIKTYFKYKNYIKYEIKNKIKKKLFLKNLKLSKNINYFKIKNLSKEISEKLNKIKPKNLKEIFNIKELKNNSFNVILKYLNI